MFEVDAVDHFRILAYQSNAPSFIGPPFNIAAALRLSTLVRRTAEFPYPIPVHYGSNTLTANNMPIMDGTKYRRSSVPNRSVLSKLVLGCPRGTDGTNVPLCQELRARAVH
jgi:hypothetical protein